MLFAAPPTRPRRPCWRTGRPTSPQRPWCWPPLPAKPRRLCKRSSARSPPPLALVLPPPPFRFWRREKIQRAFFRRFRPLEAVSQPRDSQKTVQDESPALGRLSRHPGAHAVKKRAASGERGPAFSREGSARARSTRAGPPGPGAGQLRSLLMFWRRVVLRPSLLGGLSSASPLGCRSWAPGPSKTETGGKTTPRARTAPLVSTIFASPRCGWFVPRRRGGAPSAGARG